MIVTRFDRSNALICEEMARCMWLSVLLQHTPHRASESAQTLWDGRMLFTGYSMHVRLEMHHKHWNTLHTFDYVWLIIAVWGLAGWWPQLLTVNNKWLYLTETSIRHSSQVVLVFIVQSVERTVLGTRLISVNTYLKSIFLKLIWIFEIWTT